MSQQLPIVFPFEVGHQVTVHTRRHDGVLGKISRVAPEIGFFWVQPYKPGSNEIGPVIERELSFRGLHG